ncbi:TPA: hypothetical protein RJR38_000512 [Burkholderia multivorans]|nr:hypothetical protein [Burkholderia multivorans]
MKIFLYRLSGWLPAIVDAAGARTLFLVFAWSVRDDVLSPRRFSREPDYLDASIAEARANEAAASVAPDLARGPGSVVRK